MGIDKARRRGRRWSSGTLQAAAFFALVFGCSASPVDPVEASVQAPAAVAKSTTEDACRFNTAEAIGKAFGRQMKSSKLGDICDYRGPGTDRVVVKVSAGPEGTILRHVRSTSATGDKTVEKVATAAGEAYVYSTLSLFIGRVGNHEVQIETTIEPMPRDALIAVGTRIMETLARK